jgi:hypothetical protein
VLLAFVQTPVVVLLALVMAVIATLAVLTTVGAMLSAEETAAAGPDPELPNRARSSGRRDPQASVLGSPSLLSGRSSAAIESLADGAAPAG